MSEDKHMCSTHESALHFGRDTVWQRHCQVIGNHAPASFSLKELAKICNELVLHGQTAILFHLGLHERRSGDIRLFFWYSSPPEAWTAGMYVIMPYVG